MAAAGLRALEALDVSRNGLMPEGGWAIAAAAVELTLLRALLLGGNGLGSAVAARVQEVTRGAAGLSELVLDDSGGSAETEAAQGGAADKGEHGQEAPGCHGWSDDRGVTEYHGN
jgi:hypothetical protein